MSYLNHAQDPRRRNAGIAGVITVHALLAYMLVTGLNFTSLIEQVTNPQGTFIPDVPLPQPPPPEKQEQREKQDSTITAPTSPLDPLITDDSDVAVSDNVIYDRILEVDPGLGIEPVRDPPRPAFTPRGARPANNQSNWLTNNDYPTGTEAEGTAAYRLIVGTNGRVSACEVTRSTSNRRLDDATCRLIKNRARFEAATDETGARVIGSYTGTVKWEIPD